MSLKIKRIFYYEKKQNKTFFISNNTTQFLWGLIIRNSSINAPISSKNVSLHLTPIEYKLLCLLSQNVGKVLTSTFLTQKIWGAAWENNIASLRVFMVTLRKKIETDENSPQYIQTHIGIGYRILKVK